MQAIKKINNNAIICRDGNGTELVAMGKGIGFPAIPREVGLNEIERSFYDVTSHNLELFKDIPAEVMLFAGKITDIVHNEIPREVSPNLVFTLADHIAFAMERARKSIRVKMPLAYDVELLYPEEYRIGEYILRKVRKEFHIALPPEEAVGMALNIVNAELYTEETPARSKDLSDEAMLENITDIIESEFHFIIERNTFSYTRYATHLQYLFQRIHTGKTIDTDSLHMYEPMKEEYPELVGCVEKISDYIRQEWNCELSDEEKLYLVLHVNRICSKEGM